MREFGAHRSEMVLVERKEFQMEWVGVRGRSSVGLAEITCLRFIRGFVSRECILWLSAILKSWEEEEVNRSSDGGTGGPARCWSDYLGAASVVRRENRSGMFANVEIFPSSQRGRKVLLCIPAGTSGSGWGSVGEAMKQFIITANRVVGIPSKAVPSNSLHHKSFAQVLGGVSRRVVEEDLVAGGERTEVKVLLTFSDSKMGWTKAGRSLSELVGDGEMAAREREPTIGSQAGGRRRHNGGGDDSDSGRGHVVGGGGVQRNP